MTADWTTDAACRGLDTEMFYPGPNDMETREAARSVCMGCPVRVECLEYALDNREDYGVWGGLHERERRRVRRRRTTETITGRAHVPVEMPTLPPAQQRLQGVA